MPCYRHHYRQIKALLLIVISCGLSACFGSDPAIDNLQDFISQQQSDKVIDKQNNNWKAQLPKPPQQAFNSEKRYLWQLDTNQGPMTIALLTETAPMHASSTIYLTELGFYDGLTFHRVISGFMAQGGDQAGNGTGNPGYLYAGEFAIDAKHDKRGVLSMANRGPNTDGSQFFITFNATPHLDSRHTVFGYVIAGMDTLDKIEKLGSRSGRTAEPVVINKASIRVE